MARFYDAQLGRWHSVDNKAEKYYEMSPNCYTANNPIIYIDVDGNDFIPMITDEAHAAALNNFLSTKEGYAFIAQFARAGQKIGDYSFDVSGKYVDYNLYILSASKGMDGKLGTAPTYLENAKGGEKQIRDLSLKDLPNGDNKYAFKIFLRVGESEKTTTYVLGHEAFVHSDKDLKDLVKLMEKAQNGEFNSLIEYLTKLNVIGSDAGDEHNNLKNEKNEKLKNYVKELDSDNKTNDYNKLYEDDKKKY